MNYLPYIATLLADNVQYVLLAMLSMIVLTLIIFTTLSVKLAKMNRRYRKMMQGLDGGDMEQLLTKHIEEVREAVIKVNALDKETEELKNTTRDCVQKVGMVRFNAFEDTGSDLSFAVALLDAKNNGVVVSALYGRNESRTYAKPILAGQSTYMLTAEEKNAIDKAYKKTL